MVDHETAVKQLVQHLAQLNTWADVVVCPAGSRKAATKFHVPHPGGLYRETLRTEETVERVKKERQGDPISTPPPTPPGESPAPAIVTTLEESPPRGYSHACARHIVELLQEEDRRFSGLELQSALAAAGASWSNSTVEHTASYLVKRGVLQVVRDDRGKGYGLREWGD